MKRLSIKFRVTLWFALMMLIIEALVLTFIMIINGNVVTNDPESRLISVVNHNVNEVEFDRQQFEFNDIHYYRKGVYTILYDANGTVMRGTAPVEFTANPPLQNNSVRTVVCGDTSFYVYDVNVDMVVGSVWLRGIIPTEATGGVMAAIVPVAWSVLPVLLVFMAIIAADKRVMGAYRSRIVSRVLIWVTVGIVTVLTAVLLVMQVLGI